NVCITLSSVNYNLKENKNIEIKQDDGGNKYNSQAIDPQLSSLLDQSFTDFDNNAKIIDLLSTAHSAATASIRPVKTIAYFRPYLIFTVIFALLHQPIASILPLTNKPLLVIFLCTTLVVFHNDLIAIVSQLLEIIKYLKSCSVMRSKVKFLFEVFNIFRLLKTNHITRVICLYTYIQMLYVFFGRFVSMIA
ncbi:MAG: hypothetical protein MHMPM18_002712, partial [Marteilia pararefringens]